MTVRGYALDFLLTRSDWQELTQEQQDAVTDELLNLMVDWCEAKGFYLNGGMRPVGDLDGEGKT
ncbi:hypothetical protein [Deinococcus arcticus]|uniref:Uncharacterized protein n=1 Tax=Deinococcus arcticus TaxID=2136176 RepID=A0A2T3WAX5_9DEIO|nr:hypothetical protein [Deinococcus arcticus]PTA68982.1 hypothetical protein C8263_04065 [Deinococcus arcticus]